MMASAERPFDISPWSQLRVCPRPNSRVACRVFRKTDSGKESSAASFLLWPSKCMKDSRKPVSLWPSGHHLLRTWQFED